MDFASFIIWKKFGEFNRFAFSSIVYRSVLIYFSNTDREWNNIFVPRKIKYKKKNDSCTRINYLNRYFFSLPPLIPLILRLINIADFLIAKKIDKLKIKPIVLSFL